MTTSLGDKERFAVEIGEYSNGLRRVDLWAANRWWTCDDNYAYVPQFRASLLRSLERLQSRDLALPFPGLSVAETHRQLLAADDGSHQRFKFATWGPTTDNVCALIFREEAAVSISFEFWRDTHHKPEELGSVFVATLAEDELVWVLKEAMKVLSQTNDLTVG